MASKDVPSRTISVRQLISIAKAGPPFSIVDIREQAAFGAGHILYASNMPLSRLELLAPSRLPRKDAVLVLVDSDPNRLALGVDRLEDMGFTNLRILAGGVAGWETAGLRLHIGTNVPSKLLGEFVAESHTVRKAPPSEILSKLADPSGFSIWDCRPQSEFLTGSLPAAKNVPGTSWPYQVGGEGGPAQTPLYITCAGRTRGVMAVRNLTMFGGLSDVTWIEDGLAGWQLSGQINAKPVNAATTSAAPATVRSKLRERIVSTAKAAGVPTIGIDELRTLYAEHRQGYCFDVRTSHGRPTEQSSVVQRVPGGQLAQTADDLIPTRNVPVILLDDPAGEAFMAAYWLRQLGYGQVQVAEGCNLELCSFLNLTETGTIPVPEIESLDPELACRLADQPGVLFADVSSRMQYLSVHPRGAIHCNRTSLSALVAARGPHTVLLTGHDPRVARLAAGDLNGSGLRIALVEGANARLIGPQDGWESGDATAPAEIDDYPPPDAPLPDKLDRLRAYIAWELELIGLAKNDPLEPAGFAPDYLASGTGAH